MPRSKLIELLFATCLFAVLATLIWIRAGLVDHNIGIYIACENCFNLSVLHSDLVMFYLASGALLLSGLIRARLPGRFLHLLVGLVIVFYIADLLVYHLFNYRLFLSDVALYFAEWSTVWDQFSSGVGSIGTAVLILMAVLGLLLFLFLMPAARGLPARTFLFAALLTTLITDLVLESPPFVNSWATENLFRANMRTGERVRYSPAFAAHFARSVRPEEHQQVYGAEPQSGRNVIVVLLESWSTWHSRAFGGFYDWTPRLDAAAQRGLKFTNFHSIGFATVNGLVGILGGQDIWSPFLPLFERSPFHSMWGIEKTLPRVFANAGYETAFLTTGPISLYQKGDWMRNLGFSHVEGNEHPSYAGEKLYAFRSPSDTALYRRGADWMQTAGQPYLLVLETVTTHQPYIDPDSGERSLEKAMRYADRAFGEFLVMLEATDFFEKGLLVVVSDHRSMTPVFKQELEQFGPGALSRVPAFVIGREILPATVDDRVLSQGDLVPTFELWLSGAARFGPEDANMLDNSGSGKCAFHERGDRRGLLAVICPEGHGQVFLEGDKTRFIESMGLNEERQQAILDIVTRERLAGLHRHQQTQNEDSEAIAE